VAYVKDNPVPLRDGTLVKRIGPDEFKQRVGLATRFEQTGQEFVRHVQLGFGRKHGVTSLSAKLASGKFYGPSALDARPRQEALFVPGVFGSRAPNYPIAPIPKKDKLWTNYPSLGITQQDCKSNAGLGPQKPIVPANRHALLHIFETGDATNNWQILLGTFHCDCTGEGIQWAATAGLSPTARATRAQDNPTSETKSSNRLDTWRWNAKHGCPLASSIPGDVEQLRKGFCPAMPSTIEDQLSSSCAGRSAVSLEDNFHAKFHLPGRSQSVVAGAGRSSLDVQKAVELPQVPGELALFRELPGDPSSTPFNWPPAPPKLAMLNTLKAATLGSRRTLSPIRNGQVKRRSTVLSHFACASFPGNAGQPGWLGPAQTNGYTAPSFDSWSDVNKAGVVPFGLINADAAEVSLPA
jgi:hypothetical protein